MDGQRNKVKYILPILPQEPHLPREPHLPQIPNLPNLPKLADQNRFPVPQDRPPKGYGGNWPKDLVSTG